MRIAVALGAVLVVGAGIGAANATPPAPSGYLELFGQGVWDTPPTGYDPWSGAGVGGHGTLWFAPAWSAQLDASADFASSHGITLPNETVAGHVSFRDTTRGLLGAFAGFANTNDYDPSTGVDTYAFGGVEGQLYLGNLTVYAQAGVAGQIAGEYGGPNTSYAPNHETFAQATMRFFPQPNTKLEASIGHIDGSIWGTGYPTYDIHALTLAAEIEHQFATIPVSIFARASGFADPGNATGDISEYALVGGVRFRLGHFVSLQDEDRSGTTLRAPDLSPLGWARWSDY